MVGKELIPPLKKAIKFLEEGGYRYAIIGGIALSQWGFIHVTRDVDIKVLVPKTDYETIRKRIRKAFSERARVNIPANPLIVQ